MIISVIGIGDYNVETNEPLPLKDIFAQIDVDYRNYTINVDGVVVTDPNTLIDPNATVVATPKLKAASIKLIIPADQDFIIKTWIEELNPYEIQGLGTLRNIADDIYLVEQVFLIEQTVSHSTTEIDDEALSEFMFEAKKRGLFKDTIYWWHSHGKGEAFLSPTDLDTLNKLCGNLTTIAHVIGKSGKSEVAVMVKGKNKHKQVKVVRSTNITTAAKWDKETLERVARLLVDKEVSVKGANVWHYSNYEEDDYWKKYKKF